MPGPCGSLTWCGAAVPGASQFGACVWIIDSPGSPVRGTQPLTNEKSRRCTKGRNPGSVQFCVLSSRLRANDAWRQIFCPLRACLGDVRHAPVLPTRRQIRLHELAWIQLGATLDALDVPLCPVALGIVKNQGSRQKCRAGDGQVCNLKLSLVRGKAR